MTILDQPLCTGCSACVASCPSDALVMDFDEDGFYRPKLKGDEKQCTQCGKCVKICPLNAEVAPTKTNRKKPDCFAFETNEQIAFPSSTAGGFQLIAKRFLAEPNSVVIGAAWEGLTVKHILVDNLVDLPKLYKSKYVQSFMGDILNQMKSALESGGRVLFSGTPCQVAGLYSFIAAQKQSLRDVADKNLFTIDILCHAAPPPKVFERYIEETFGKDNVVEYTFRAKEPGHAFGYGWVVKLKVKFKNQSVRFLSMLDDLFGKLFLKDVTMGKHCEQCRFAAYPRCGDVTLADFWAIEKSDPQFQGGRTEAVLANNTKGDFLIRPIKESAIKWQQKPLDTLLRGNVKEVDVRQRKADPNRDRFFSYIKRMPVTQAGNACLNNTYDIGLIGMPLCKNYGATLTTFALLRVLQDLGRSVLLISPPLNSYEGSTYQDLKGWKHPPYRLFDIAPQSKTTAEMRQLNANCDMFLVGSDQLFGTKGIYERTGKYANLNWAFDYKKKAAYAASFNNPYITCSEQERAEMAYYLSKFDYFSVREKSGVELCKREFNVKADWVLDPVFLCDPKYYKSFLISSTPPDKPILSCYVMENQDDLNRIVDEVSQRLSLHPIIMGGVHRTKNSVPVEDWLSAFYHADFVVTDSFHGTCFCLIFQKPFVTVCDKPGDHQYRTPERLKSILELVGLKDRLVYDYAGYEKIRDRLTDIDWQSVNAKLDEAKRQSLAALEKAIEPKRKNMSDRDISWLERVSWEQEYRWEIRLHKLLKRLYKSRYIMPLRAIARRIRSLLRLF